jgi:signal transduction histidine kinase
MLADYSSLLTNLTHQLRQPLSTIESIAYYLELALPQADPKVKEQLQRLRDSVAQSDGLLRDALAIAQLGPARPVTVDWDELLSEFAAPHFSLSLGGAPVLLDYMHSRKMAESLCELLKHHSKSPAITTRELPGGSVLVSASGIELPIEKGNLALECLERLAEANGVRLYLNLDQQLTLDLPAAPLAAANREALAASAAVGPNAPVAPSIP